MANSILQQLHARADSGNPLRVGLIGAGKFSTMFLAQAHRIPGLHVAGIADLAPDRIREALQRIEWPPEQSAATDVGQALKTGATWLTDDGEALIRADGIDVIIESTGNPIAGVKYALQAIEHRKHVVMVNVEADVLAGPLLARQAAAAGVVYTMAYGDQPALICEMVDWARMSGFDVVCAGKGTKYLPEYHASTPDTVWDHFGYTAEQIEHGGFNPRLFNSFLDGTKSAIEMSAVANATGLTPQPHGLGFPPCGMDDIADVCRPERDGGRLTHSGAVEVISSLERDGSPVERDLRWGVYITFEAPSDYIRRCFTEYGVMADSTGRYGALYRPTHFVGMELSVSVLKAGLKGEATGCPVAFTGDVSAVAKRDLAADEILDGEGGYGVYGVLHPAADALGNGLLPIGLAHNVRLKRDIPAGQSIRWSDVAHDDTDPVVRLRREMEQGMSER